MPLNVVAGEAACPPPPPRAEMTMPRLSASQAKMSRLNENAHISHRSSTHTPKIAWPHLKSLITRGNVDRRHVDKLLATGARMIPQKLEHSWDRRGITIENRLSADHNPAGHQPGQHRAHGAENALRRRERHC
eukprot:6117180-Pleurochrysis_carterae.AAC.1